MNLLRGALLCNFLFLATDAMAYIPNYHMILSRVAETHGRGLYEIEQEVIFPADPEPLVIKETWWVSDENSLRVTFEGRGNLRGLTQGTFVYEGGTRWGLTETGERRSSSLSKDWWEPFFHFRYSKNFKPRLVALGIAPPESLRERKLVSGLKTNEPTAYSEQNFMRLSRAGGSVAYAIGKPSLPENSDAAPGLWIEQDQFVIRKFRLPSQVVVTADEYSRHTQDLYLPRLRTVRWGNYSAQIQVLSVRSYGKQSPQAKLLKSASLEAARAKDLAAKLPDVEIVRDFYQRFR